MRLASFEARLRRRGAQQFPARPSERALMPSDAAGRDPFAMADPTRVLIAGAGVAAFEATLALGETAGARVDVELVAPETRFWYRPLAVAEPFGLGEVRSFDLPELAAAAGAHLTPGRIVAVDAGAHVALTDRGAELPYDRLLLATGADPRPAVPGVESFRGPADTEAIRSLLRALDEGTARSVAFCISPGAGWVLPGYELALLLSAYAAARRVEGVRIAVVTLEEEPLELFGEAASRQTRELLERRGIELHTRAYAAEARDGELRLVPDATLRADRVVALPALHGVPIDGVPQTRAGFVVVDDHGRLPGFHDLFAAGDLTTFPVKQGGIAAQQAEAAAEAIAAELGLVTAPRPFSPVLRGLLLTGEAPRYLRHEPGAESTISPEPLWWPPAKIVGRYLAPFLARLADSRTPREAAPPPGALTVERRLEREELDRADERRRAAAAAGEDDDDRAAAVRDVLSTDVVVVAPDDTLGEIAGRMRERDVGSALVADAGRLIGILTSRDLLRAFAGRVHASEARAREWMTSEPLTVEAATPLPAALRLMTDHGIHHLPVVEGERAVGMVGARQVARAVAEQARTHPRIGLGL
jgi:sulfide:quinone oxidoreductase